LHGGSEGLLTCAAPAFQFRVFLRIAGVLLKHPYLPRKITDSNFFLAFLKPLSYYYDIRIMGTSKKEAFSNNQNRLADLAKALAHPARIAILEFLAKQDTCVCGDIVDELPLSQATVSQHLAELKRIGLIKGEIEGPKVCYCINKKNWQEAKQILAQFLNDTKSSC
jgi:ArsR family transcriptional regulator, arsenate/arsenite/antimonite-responsive transcriptional repressor